MVYTTSAAFAKDIKSLGKDIVSVRSNIQKLLVSATYLCLDNSGGTTPFQQILDAVGGTAHRAGISTWMETFAPVRMVKEKVLLNKTAWDALDREAALANFEQFIVDTEMNEPTNLWYVIAKHKNDTPSIFDLDKTFDAFLKKLEKNNLPELASAMRKAEQEYMASAGRSELIVEQERVEVAA